MNDPNKPRFMSIKQIAALGIISEYTLRIMEKRNELPCIHSGKKCLVNVDLLIERLNNLGGLEQ